MPRDINGVYTLPAGNPVVPGTVISTDWANTTLTDIASALTASITKTDADARYLQKTGGTLTGNLTVPSLNGGQLAGMRNRIINGDFRVWQRGTSFTIPASGALVYTADCWGILALGAGVTAAPSSIYNPGHKSMLVYGAAGNTYTTIQQRIESLNIESEVGKPFTLSLEVVSSNARAINLYLQTPDTSDNFNGPVTTFASRLGIPLGASTVTPVTLSGTIPAGGVRGVLVLIECGALLAGQSIAIASVQLEAGAVATPFEHRPYGVELALCQRYYQELPTNFTVSGSTSGVGATFILPVSMRAVPTVTHKFLDASYAVTYPAAGQWLMMNIGVESASKTGTINTLASATDNTSVVIHFYGMTLSAPVNYVLAGDDSFAPKLSAEL